GAYRAIKRREQQRDELKDSLREMESRIYEGRPILVLEVSGYTSGGNRVWGFLLRNTGQRAARYVKMETQESAQAKYRLHFIEIPALVTSCPVQFWVEENGDSDLIPVEGDSVMLRNFIADETNQADPGARTALRWWDIRIKFRDTDETVREEI